MITIIAIITAILFGLLSLEYLMHVRNLKSIRMRIHVNGTRGKSSVTRLVAGALKEHGLRTFAKTTGTLPRMITHDGHEFPIYRPARANIIEQLRIIAFARANRAEALVIECMALQPYLQALSERKMVRATHGIITNARADHLEIMGPRETDVVKALLGTTPIKGRLYTAEQDYLPDFRAAADDRGSELIALAPDHIADVTDADMAGFTYVEHKENVALVLEFCRSIGVPRETALKGMWQAKPDPGAMSEYEIEFFGRRLYFVNGFAANDPESSERIWRMALAKHPEVENRVMILNLRSDRMDRSRQLGDAICTWPPADRYVLMGSGVYVLFRRAVAKGMQAAQFVYAEGMEASRIFEEIVGLCGASALVMGIGNIAGPGLELIHVFRNRSIPRR